MKPISAPGPNDPDPPKPDGFYCCKCKHGPWKFGIHAACNNCGHKGCGCCTASYPRPGIESTTIIDGQPILEPPSDTTTKPGGFTSVVSNTGPTSTSSQTFAELSTLRAQLPSLVSPRELAPLGAPEPLL